MLPDGSKLRRSQDFAAVVRYGRRAGTRHLVLHLLLTGQAALSASDRPSPAPRAGFVVSAKVGNSVARHRVTRRLRPLILSRLADLPAGTDLVIRALPAAADAGSASLASDLDRALKAASGYRPAAAVDTVCPAGPARPAGPVFPAGSPRPLSAPGAEAADPGTAE